MFERAIAAPLWQDILEDAFDAMIASSKLSQEWAAKYWSQFPGNEEGFEMRGPFAAVVSRGRADSSAMSSTAASRRVAPPCPKLSTDARTLLARNLLNFGR